MDFKRTLLIATLCSLPWLCEAQQAGYLEPWGKDSHLAKKAALSDDPAPRRDWVGRCAETLILFHQNVLSPVDGPRSHFRPTSARYTLLAIRRYGFLKGALMGFDRLIRENKEEWVYPKIVVGETQYKYDPTY